MRPKGGEMAAPNGKEGIIYVFVNEAMPGYVKVGKTEDIERRISELDWTNLPLPFECFYAARVGDAAFVESQLHDAFGDHRVRSRREFFRISPERVVAAVRIAEIENVTPGQSLPSKDAENAEVQQDLREARERRARFNFTMVDIPVGAVLTFTRDDKVTAVVTDAKHVSFNGQITSLSDAARKALSAQGYHWVAVQGPLHWKYEGEILEERRRRMEESE